MRSLQSMGEARLDDGNHDIFWRSARHRPAPTPIHKPRRCSPLAKDLSVGADLGWDRRQSGEWRLLELSPTFQRRAPWIAAVIAIGAYYPRFIKEAGGLLFYPAAAECMLHGETPLHCKTTLFTYPPFFALLVTPLVAMPVWLREAVWYLVLIGTLVASLQLCEALARRLFPGEWTQRELAQFRVLTFVLSLKFMLAVLENQAFDSIALVFILLGLLALVSERSVLAGAGFAVAAALKVTPLIFLPYLLIKRRFAAAAAFVVVLVLLTLLPDILLPPKESWHVTVWLREVVLGPFFSDPASIKLQFWVGSTPLNQSLRAAVGRIFNEGDQPQQFAIALRIVIGLYILGVGIVMLKSLRHDRLIAVDGALLVISALLLSPVTSQSHFVGLMLPYSILAAALIRDRSTSASNAAVLLASFVLATATSNDLVGRSFTGWALWNNLPVWGTLVLIVQLGVLIWSRSVRRVVMPR
jgi:alpha-1,2-mannosyltransferase